MSAMKHSNAPQTVLMTTKATGGKRKRGAGEGAPPIPVPEPYVYTVPFSLGGVPYPPVVVEHGPQGSGNTTVLKSLIYDAHTLLGARGAVVVSDRGTQAFQGFLPAGVVTSKPADRVLTELLRMQAHRAEGGGDAAATRPLLVLAMDDVCNGKMLKSEAFQRDVKRAKDHDIVILISTSNAEYLPANLRTFATHVFASKCYAHEDVKTLHKRMFVAMPKVAMLEEALDTLGPHEYLVGTLRQEATGAPPPEAKAYRAKAYMANVPVHAAGASAHGDDDDDDGGECEGSEDQAEVNTTAGRFGDGGDSGSDDDIGSNDDGRNTVVVDDAAGSDGALPTPVFPPVRFVMSADLVAHLSETLHRL